MKIFSSKKRVAAIGAITAATLVGGGVAVAYWTTTGEGNGSASTGTTVDYDVKFDDAVLGGTPASTTPLSPDGPEQLHHVTVTNLGSGAQQVQDVIVRVGNSATDTWEVTDAGGAVVCSAADYELEDASANWVTEASVLAAPFTLDGAGGAVDSVELPVNVRMIDTNDDQNGCKGVTVPLFASVS